MKWYYNIVDDDNETARPQGPFDTEQLATKSRTTTQQNIEAAGAVFSTTDPFEASDDYIKELPRAVSRFATKEGEQQLLTDGTIEHL